MDKKTLKETTIQTKETVKQTLDKFGFPLLGSQLAPLLQDHPHLQLAFYAAIGIYGLYLNYNQDKLNEFTEFIKDNPESFTKEITKTQSFKDGFVITLEQYLKSRYERKRRIVQRIFIGFISTQDRKNFELERMYNTLNLISLDAIKYLSDNYKNLAKGSLGWGKKKENREISAEMISLGIVKTEVVDILGGAFLRVQLNKFGQKFVTFLKDDIKNNS